MDTQVVAYSEEGDGPSTGKARHPWPLSNPTRPRREMSFAERLEEARPHIELMARVFAQYHSPTPFLAIDLDQLTQSYHLWERTIGAPPHYAVKCNDAPAFLLHLDTLGSLFDAASGGELRQLVNDLGIPGEKIIATHPSRDDDTIAALRECKPRAIVVDTVEEVGKLAKARIPSDDYNPELFVRFSLDNKGLSGAFGVEVIDSERPSKVQISEVRDIFRTAKRLGFKRFGISTHVGTNSTTTDRFEAAFEVFAKLSAGLKEFDIEVNIFDMGGGYPDVQRPLEAGTTQERFMEELGAVVADFRERNPQVELLAEPGRLFAHQCGTLFAAITGIKKKEEKVGFRESESKVRVKELGVRINDGVFLSLSGQSHDGRIPDIIVVKQDGSIAQGELVPCGIKGATCDSEDVLEWKYTLPKNIEIGDVVVILGAGDYTISVASKFNGSRPPYTYAFRRTADGGIDGELMDYAGNKIMPVAASAVNGSANLDELLNHNLTVLPSLVQLLTRAGADAGDLDPEQVKEILSDKVRAAAAAVGNNETTLRLKDVEGIAAGGMGVVFQGTESELRRRVALKVGLDPVGTEAATRFEREVAQTWELAAGNASIPNIIRAGVLPEGRLPYYTMELVEGSTLESLIHEFYKMVDVNSVNWRNESSARGLLTHLGHAAEALDYAHRQGVIHRDVKPNNLMVPSDREIPIKVIDWGLLQASLEGGNVEEQVEVDQPGLTKEGLGTIDYMSPEQARGESVDARADVWSLGASLYRMLCDEVPLAHHGAGAMDRLRALRSDATELVLPPSKRGVNIPRELEAIVMKALRCDPEARYASAADFQRDLQNFLDRRPVEAYRESLGLLGAALYSTRLWLRRQRTPVTWTLALLTTVSGGVFAKHVKDEQEKQQIEQQAEEDKKRIRVESEKAATERIVREKFEDAQFEARAGNLKSALDKLPIDIVKLYASNKESLNQIEEEYPSLASLLKDIAAHDRDWTTLSVFKRKIFDVHSKLVSSFEFGEIEEIDVDGLREAAEIYLPEGELTEESIAALRERLDRTRLTQEQRMQVGDGLMEWAVLEVEREYRDVITELYVDAMDQCPDVLERIRLMELLAKACEGSVGESTAWLATTEYLKRVVYFLQGDKERETGAYHKVAEVGRGRGSNEFLIANLAYNRSSDDEFQLSLGMGGFTNALSVDPNHLAVNHVFSTILFRYVKLAESDKELRYRYNRWINVLQHCAHLDPTNPYMLGRLAVACQMAWDKERGIDTKDRVSKSLLFRGTKAGKEAIDLCQASGIEVPVSLWLAYGELSLSMIKYADASLALSKVLEAESSNARAYVMWACARLGLSKALDENKTLPFLKRAKAMKVPDGRLLPEVAAIYTYLSEKACLEGDKSRAESYRSEAIDCIRKSIEQAPGYKGMTIRMIPFWYNWLNDDARFQELVTE